MDLFIPSPLFFRKVYPGPPQKKKSSIRADKQAAFEDCNCIKGNFRLMDQHASGVIPASRSVRDKFFPAGPIH